MSNPQSSPYAPNAEETPHMARPKLLRRPPQFSEIPEKLPAPTESAFQLQTVPAPAESLPAAHPWQDDARFGMVMLVVVIVVNLALMAWLPHLGRVDNISASPIAIQNSAMPASTIAVNPQITTYSRTDMADRPPVISHAVDLQPSSNNEFDAPIQHRHLLDETSGNSNQ
jgi:hypothetical protein